MNLPIVFTHKGYSEYMEYSLRQAKYSNPDSKIILLGDESNDRFDFITHVNMQDYFSSATEFSKIYKHYSTNPYNYELFCIQRWFVLKEYMKQNNIEKCFVCDTDVMIYSNIDEALEPFKEADIAILQHDSEHCSLGISFLKLNCLQCFCKYIIQSYTSDENFEKFEKYYLDTIAKYTVGGVSDMTLVGSWLKEIKNKKIMNLISMYNDSIFDNHIGVPFQGEDASYKFCWGHKIITWQSGKPYCYSGMHQKDIKFHLLHFQGPTKYLMVRFYTGELFSGKLRFDVKFFLANIAAFWYKTLRIRYRFAWLFSMIFKLKSKCKNHYIFVLFIIL